MTKLEWVAKLYSIFSMGIAGISVILLIPFLFSFDAIIGIDTKIAFSELPVVFNVGLLALFGLQHSGMARDGFKKILHPLFERSTFVLASGIALLLIVFKTAPVIGTE